MLERLNALLGFECNDWLTLARVPPIMASAMNLCSTVIEAAADCGEHVRWLVCYAASRSFGCQYCVAHTAFVAEQTGVPGEKLSEIDRFESAAVYSEPERAAIRIAIGMGRCPTSVNDADFATLQGHFNEQQVVSIVSLAAMMGFFNRWNDTMATELETRPRQSAEKLLASMGWSPGKHHGAS